MNLLGVNFILRKLAKTATPVYEIKQNGEEYSIKSSSAIKTSEIKFKLGEEFEEDRMDGVRVKVSFWKLERRSLIIIIFNYFCVIVMQTVIVAEANKLIQTQFGDKEVKIIREFNGDELKVVRIYFVYRT